MFSSIHQQHQVSTSSTVGRHDDPLREAQNGVDQHNGVVNGIAPSIDEEEEIDLLGRNMLSPAQLPVDPDDEDPVDPEDWARLKVLELLHASHFFVGFTWGGQGMALDWVIKGTAFQRRRRGFGSHVIVSAIDVPCIFDMAAFLQREDFSVSVLAATNGGKLDLHDLQRILRPDTILVSAPLASVAAYGLVQPIDKLVKIVRDVSPHALIHSDISHVVGRLKINLVELGVDMATFGGKDIDGPYCVGTVVAAPDTVASWHHGPEDIPADIMRPFGVGAKLNASLYNSRHMDRLATFFKSEMERCIAYVFSIGRSQISTIVLFLGDALPKEDIRLAHIIHILLVNAPENAAYTVYERLLGRVTFRQPMIPDAHTGPVRPILELVLSPQLTESRLSQAAEWIALEIRQLQEC